MLKCMKLVAYLYILASVVELAASATSAFTYTFSKWPRIVFYLYFFYKKEKKCMTLSHIFLIQNPISENIPLILSENILRKHTLWGPLKVYGIEGSRDFLYIL